MVEELGVGRNLPSTDLLDRRRNCQVVWADTKCSQKNSESDQATAAAGNGEFNNSCTRCGQLLIILSKVTYQGVLKQMTTAQLIREYQSIKPCPVVQELLRVSTSYSQFIELVAERLGVVHARRIRFLSALIKRDRNFRCELQSILQASFDMRNDVSKRHFWFVLTAAQARQKVKVAKAIESYLLQRQESGKLRLLSIFPESLFIPFFGSYGDDHVAAFADALSDIAEDESDFPDSEL